jgi:hypothetical protein
MGKNNMAKSILDMLSIEAANPDATLTALDVFEEKSKDADDAMEYGMGLSQEELLDIAMSVTPMGRAKAGKGAISFLKGLFGKFKSQNIAKPNRRETEKIINKLMKSVEPNKAFMREVAEHEKNISGLQKSQKNIQKLLKEYDDVYGVLEKPKGMRKVGVRVKPDPEEYGGVWTEWRSRSKWMVVIN